MEANPKLLPDSSSRNGMTPIYMIPSSSVQGFALPSTMTILRKKSPEFRSEKVSWLRFASVSTFSADWMYTFSRPVLTMKSISACFRSNDLHFSVPLFAQQLVDILLSL